MSIKHLAQAQYDIMAEGLVNNCFLATILDLLTQHLEDEQEEFLNDICNEIRERIYNGVTTITLPLDPSGVTRDRVIETVEAKVKNIEGMSVNLSKIRNLGGD